MWRLLGDLSRNRGYLLGAVRIAIFVAPALLATDMMSTAAPRRRSCRRDQQRLGAGLGRAPFESPLRGSAGRACARRGRARWLRVTVSTGSLRRCDTGPAAFALGSTTFMPARDATSDSTSAVEVTMKMMSRTRNTSVSGVMLISATTISPPTSASSLAAGAVVELDVDSHGVVLDAPGGARFARARRRPRPACASRPGRARSGTPRRTGGSASR